MKTNLRQRAMTERLDILFVTLFPPSPPEFGAQRRIEGLMRALSRRHRVCAASLLSREHDARRAEEAMRAYCDEVVLVPSRPERGPSKRVLQLRSLLSPRSFEATFFTIAPMQRALDALLARRRFDVVSLEAPFLGRYDLRRAAPRGRAPKVLLDEHNIEHDLARQSLEASEGFLRRLHHAANWRKVRREEIAAWRAADGVAFTSEDDARRAHALFPAIRAAVVPNAVDLAHFRPSAELPGSDGRTAMFFGTMSYFPNQDGVRWLFDQIWPRLERSHADARLRIVGPNPTPELVARRSARVEVAGRVDDLRPHLASAAVAIVPLRVGGGTRFKILEAMAMGRPVVSTTVGAEGIGAIPEREILIADTPDAFAAAVGRVLDDPALARRLGEAGRALVERRYSWNAVGDGLERFLGELVADGAQPAAESAGIACDPVHR